MPYSLLINMNENIYRARVERGYGVIRSTSQRKIPSQMKNGMASLLYMAAIPKTITSDKSSLNLVYIRFAFETRGKIFAKLHVYCYPKGRRYGDVGDGRLDWAAY